MLKRLARLVLVATVVLFSALNADMVVSDDSFSCKITKDLELTEICNFDPNTCESFTRSSIEILAEQDGEDFDDLLVKTVKELVAEIAPEKAAQMCLACVKNTYDKTIATINFEAITDNQSEDEAKQALGNLLQNLSNAMTSKDSALEQAIYFATFSDEIVKDITNTMAALTQEHVTKMSQFQCKNEAKEIATEIKKLVDAFLMDNLNATATVFETHGYKIDRQSLGL